MKTYAKAVIEQRLDRCLPISVTNRTRFATHQKERQMTPISIHLLRYLILSQFFTSNICGLSQRFWDLVAIWPKLSQ